MTERAEHKRSKLPWLRAGVQMVCLVAFVYFALAAQLGWKSALPIDLFLRFDPLIWLVVSTAAREVAVYGWFALALVVVTVLFGRVFCGWMCPLGAVIDAAGILRGRRPRNSLAGRLSRVRFWVLMMVIGAAVAGVNLAGWLDPLVMGSRAIHLGRGAPLDWAAATIGWTLIAAVIGLVFLAPRFWCRTLCPLGAILSLFARMAPYRRRVAESCTQCGECSAVCPMGRSGIEISSIECITCRRCEAACPEQATGFAFGAVPIRGSRRPEREQPTDPRRRRFVLGFGSLAAGGAAGFMLRLRSSQAALRPPSRRSEQEFVARCVGCGSCLAVCPTGGLLPLVSAHRLDALFTPRLVPEFGICLPGCTACAEACPTGAIAKISTEDKPTVQIGLAVIDRSRCLPWAGGERCVICADACPPEYNAIELRRTETGEFRPFVNERLCPGCGICEQKCPVEGGSAIRVVPGIRSGQRSVLPSERVPDRSP